jgi:CRP-like cAMP-binding protein
LAFDIYQKTLDLTPYSQQTLEALFQVLDTLTKLSPESKQAIASIVTIRDLPKGCVLIKPGTTCRHMFFIERGLTRTFYFKDGKDVTDWLSVENSFAVSVISFITQQPDRRGIELLEDSRICEIPHDKLEQLCSSYHDIERLGRLLANSGVVQIQQRFDDLHFATASTRYKTLIDTSPSILQRVPLGMVASFLGITQETLSRIRAAHDKQIPR